MYPRSRIKAFRNAILWTWWLPLFLAAVGAGWWHNYSKNQPAEWVTFGKVIVVLPGGQAPDEATMQAHVSLLESSTVAEQAAFKVKWAHPEVTLPRSPIKVTSKKSGLIHVTATGPDELGPQVHVNESMSAYIATVESMRENASLAGEKLNRKAVPTILELAGAAVEKPRETELTMGPVIFGGGVAGLLLTFLISGVWAFFRPASTQPSLNEIVKAATGLDVTSHAVLVEWLRGRVGHDVHGDYAA